MIAGAFDSFIVRKGSQQLGPLSPKQILQQLKNSELGFDIQVFDKKSTHWGALARHDSLAGMISKELREAKNTRRESKSYFSNWFIADGANKYGPFTLLQMVQYLQMKRLSYEDLVYHPNYHVWRRVSDLTPFRLNNIKALFQFTQLRPMFIARQNPRVKYENRVLVYDENAFYNGATWSLSRRGIGVILDKNTPFKVGSELQLHINRRDEHGAVQMKCKVVSRQTEKKGERLGLIFRQEVDSINEYIETIVP